MCVRGIVPVFPFGELSRKHPNFYLIELHIKGGKADVTQVIITIVSSDTMVSCQINDQ